MDKNSNKNRFNFQSSTEIIEYIKLLTSNTKDLANRELDLDNKKFYILFLETLVSSQQIGEFVIKSIKDSIKYENTIARINEIENNLKNIDNTKETNKYSTKFGEKSLKQKLTENIKQKKNVEDNLVKTLEQDLDSSKVKKLDLEQDDLFYYLYSGFTLIIYNTCVIAVETKRNLDRSIAEPSTEASIKGPKDAFVENYEQNIGLIRRRIKDEKLVLDEKKIGRRSKTKVGILYIKDIAKPELIKQVEDRLNGIDIDAILDSNYILEIIEDKNDNTHFPTIISSERPDVISLYLLQGRVALVVENSPFVLVVPAFIIDFVNNIADNYQRNLNVTFTKIIRYLAFFITIVTPAIYIALTTFDQESIPADLLVSFATQRDGVPFSAFVESLLMIISFEILREGDYRVPNAAGSTLSIVGALILGDAAVSAGIVSPIMIIVIAITTISGLMFNDLNMTNTLRTWRIIFLIFASMAGVVGLGISVILFITKIASVNSFSKSFIYPLAPLNFNEIDRRVIQRKNIVKDNKRQKILTDNLTKLRIKGER